MEVLNDSIFPERAFVYAGFGQRFGAALVDGIVLIVPNLIISYMMGSNRVMAFVIEMVLQWLYYALQESGTQQATIGKRAVGLKVTDMSGGRISFANATGRHFGKFISTIILFIGYLMVIWDPKKQALHDKMANTLVLNTGK